MSDAALTKEEETVSSVTVSSVSADGTQVNVSSVKVTSRWGTRLHHKNLARSIGAVASLAGAVSVLVGVLATHMSPRGWRHVQMMLHLTKKPLIMQLAPFIAEFAVTAATVAGLLSFYSWYRESQDQKASQDAGAPR